MNKSRTIFIGDIHGCYDEFILLVEKLKLTDNDKVYLAGDMINKGPNSYKVIKFLYKNKDQFKAIKGNHEVGFLNWLDGKAPKYENEIYRKLREKLEKKPKKLEFIKNLPTYIETDDFLLLHGGMKYDKKIEDHSVTEIVNLREYNGELWYKNYNKDKKIIYGHNAVDGLQIREKTIGLDSGCVYGKSLTAYVLETGEIYSQNALNIYEKIY